MPAKKIRVKLAGPDAATAYVSLPGNTHAPGVAAKTVRLDSVIGPYPGPMVNLDFDKDGRLIGIEILVFDRDTQV